MKYLYLLLLFFCCVSLSAPAQSIVWSPPGAEWHFSAGTFVMNGFAHLKYDSDTIIDGQPCKKLVEHIRTVNQSTWNITDTYANYYTYEANGVVYDYAPIFQTSPPAWDTLYNFNAVPGDSWNYRRWIDVGLITVLDTGHIMVNGQNLKWYLPGAYSQGIPGNAVAFDTVYERIGSAGYRYPFDSFLTTDPEIYSFCNYSDNSFPDWNKADAACRFLPTSREDDISEVQFTIYPNPASEKVKILGANPTSGFLEVELYDIYGRKVIREKLKAESQTTGFELNLANLPAGVYIVKILQSQVKTQFLRLVKE